MKATIFSALLGTATLLMSSFSFAGTIELGEWGFNLDGTSYCPFDCLITGSGALPPEVDISNFNLNTGLGSVTITTLGVGAHSLISYFDHDIDSAINNYYNENATSFNSAALGQSWEIDEPDFIGGNIFANFQASTLDNGIFDSPVSGPDDVAMAIGWVFSLAAGEMAVAEFLVTETLPTTGGLILNHFDPDSSENIYFTSSLSIESLPVNGVSEPSILAIFGLGLAGLGFARRHNA
jgi:hypothetical protein